MTVAAVETLNFGLEYLAAAARDRGHELVLLTADRSRYSYYLDRGLPDGVEVVDTDTSDVDAMVKLLRDIPGLAGVMRFLDDCSEESLAVAQRLGLPHDDPAAVSLLRDKGRLRRHLFDHGFSREAGRIILPQQVDAADLAATLPFPCILKDTRGTFSRNVWMLDSPADVQRVLAEARAADLTGGALVAEPIFPGPMYSAETITWDGRTRLLGITSRGMSPRPSLREETASFPVAVPPVWRDELTAWLGAVLASAGYRSGVTHTEFIRTPAGFEIVEVNTRLGGALVSTAVNESLGLNFHSAVVDLALGRRPTVLDEVGEATHGVSTVALYAPRTGIFEGLDGTGRLASHPGSVRLHPLRRAGDVIRSTHDQYGVVAFVTADGETAELALHNASAAANQLVVTMR